MAYAATMMGGSGIPSGMATAINGGEQNVTSAGSAYSDSTQLPKMGLCYAASVGSGEGVKIAAGAPGDSVVIANHDASNALLVYPPASAAINRLTATTQGFSVTANKTAIFFCVSATQWVGGFLT